MEELDVREATLITADEAETLSLATGNVHVVPAWDWLLDPTPRR